MNEKRKQIEALINKVMMALDPSGVNAKKYQSMFSKMNDKQFSDWITKFLDDDKSNFRLDIQEFGPRKLQYEYTENAAKVLGIKLYEYVYLPHLSSNKNRPVRTRFPVLVGYLNIKRTQQFVTKKTGLSTSDTNRDEQTGIAKGDSKGGTTTGIENELLAGVGGETIISEISGARGDNVTEYNNMINMIAETGSVKLKDIKTGVYDKPTLLKTDLLFIGMGLKTDIISESYYSIDKVKTSMRNTGARDD